MWINPDHIIDKSIKISDSIGDFNLSFDIFPTPPEPFDEDTDRWPGPPLQSYGIRDRMLTDIPAVAKEIIEKREPASISDTLNFECFPVFYSDTSGYVNLPADFLKLGAFRMSDWETTAFNPLPATSLARRLQQTPYPGLKAHPSKPEIFLAPSPCGFRLEFFGCENREAYPVVASYIPIPEVNDKNLIFLPADILTELIKALAR